MRTKVLVDSGVLVATFDRSDPLHETAIAFFQADDSTLIFPEITVVEAAVLIKRAAGIPAMADFMRAFIRTEPNRVLLDPEDYRRGSQIAFMYRESRFDFVDVCLMAMSERLNITRVATFDERDFRIFKLRHCDYLDLVP